MIKYDVRNMNRVYSHLQDEESEYIYNLRLKYAIDRNVSGFLNEIRLMNEEKNGL